MSSCAIETCERSSQRGGPGCDMCGRVAMLPQPVIRDALRAEKNTGRDGSPKLAGERKRGSLAFQKRHRVGPHR